MPRPYYVVCRKCDLVMEFEGENPKGYLLFECRSCGNRMGINVVEIENVPPKGTKYVIRKALKGLP